MNAIANRNDGPVTLDQAVTQLRNQLVNRADDFKMALPAHITPEKFQRTLITAAQSNPDLLKADRRSLINSAMKAAQDGLLPDGREAAIVIFSSRKKVGNDWVSVDLAQYMPMAYGVRKKILQSGEISSLETNVVYRREVEEGAFIFEAGTEAMLRHRPMLELADEDLADENIVAAYSVATMKDGSKSFEVMRRAEINKVRQASQTGATGRVVKFGKDKGKEIAPKGPWVDWFGEMARKTVMRRHSKTLPMSGDVLDVEAKDEALYAASANMVMASEEERGGTILPSRDQLGHDPETGEVIDNGEEDEESARALDVQTSGWQEGPADEQRGEANAVTFEAAKAQIDGCETVIDVNSKVAALVNDMSDDDADILREHAMERIAELKAPKK
ncbi:recombinase RecT [Sphingobium sp. ZW T5_29]|uniref:recombinase RecT n=1 Tax=Sphingobium sp. ZW T5_29 TaxID=3378077 RepID=UPI00385509D5